MGNFIRKNDGERKVLGKMKDEPKKRKMMEIQDVSRLVQWQWTQDISFKTLTPMFKTKIKTKIWIF